MDIEKLNLKTMAECSLSGTKDRELVDWDHGISGVTAHTCRIFAPNLLFFFPLLVSPKILYNIKIIIKIRLKK